MYTRRLTLPGRSFFVFGPRGTGKTTWLRQVLPGALWFDLLQTQVFLDLSQRPEAFRQQVEARAPGGWVVVDEVQRLPSLLNEVHALISEHGRRYRFALSGSSARKLVGAPPRTPAQSLAGAQHPAPLVRGRAVRAAVARSLRVKNSRSGTHNGPERPNVNPLAGRALNRQFFPLTASELDFEVELDGILRYGLLPQVCDDREYAVDTLDAYVANYLREEVQQEALVRRLDSFARFLRVAALVNGQVVNLAGVARDASVARPTVQGYFDVLTDTLIGTWLPAWRRRAKVKEVASPKFYLFDPGAARALAGRVREPLDALERGFLLETWILHELRAAIAFDALGGELSYWRTPSGSEVDFVWTRGSKAVGVEVKASSIWRREFGGPLKSLITDGVVSHGFGVYTGTVELKDGPLRVLPLTMFLRDLTMGRILR